MFDNKNLLLLRPPKSEEVKHAHTNTHHSVASPPNRNGSTRLHRSSLLGIEDLNHRIWSRKRL